MQNRVLLVGGTGFVGANLGKYLQSDYQVLSRGRDVDVRDAEKLKQVVASFQPDAVVHLAAMSTVPESVKKPYETYEVNFTGTLNLLTALQENGFRGRVLYVSSAQVYGAVEPNALPVLEDVPLKPISPYGVSKVAAEALCFQWSRSADFEIVVARPFNHIGPGQSERFAISDFAKQVIEIKKGLRDPVLSVGDLDVTRDFTDVRDVIRAYALLLTNGENGDIFNVCSGVEHSIRKLLLLLLELAGVKARIEQVTERFRPVEQRRLFGSFRKLCKKTGWHPEIPVEQSLTDILKDWRERIRE